MSAEKEDMTVRSVLLIGMGRFGMSVAKKLNEMNVQVMAVDMDEERIDSCLDIVTRAQIGDSTNEAFIATLGVSAYDACILAIGDDFQSSLETACLLKEQGAKKVIARACSDVQEKFLLRNGADEVVFPEKQLGFTMRCTVGLYSRASRILSCTDCQVSRETIGS